MVSGIDAPLQQRTVVSADGTAVACYLFGQGPGRLVLAPGLGTPVVSWKRIIEEFKDLYTILTWDPRGTYRSQAPADENALRLENHVEDFEAIVATLQWDSFVLGGWSMGVQISLEFAHRHPHRVRGLALINGAYEHVLETAMGVPFAGPIFTSVLKAGTLASPVIGPVLTRVLGASHAAPLLQKAGVVSEANEFFKEMLHAFSRGLDWGRYFRMMVLLNEHSARPYLHKVQAPTLITAGTRDAMTPVHKARELHRAIRGSELFIVPNGTHYTITEYPEILNLRLERFLRERDPHLFAQREAGRPQRA